MGNEGSHSLSPIESNAEGTWACRAPAGSWKSEAEPSRGGRMDYCLLRLSRLFRDFPFLEDRFLQGAVFIDGVVSDHAGLLGLDPDRFDIGSLNGWIGQNLEVGKLGRFRLGHRSGGK